MDQYQRNEIVEQYVNLVRREAERLHRRLPPSVELDDLVSDGVLGLMDALDRFDAKKSKLQTFAPRRIRGAMLDGLRSRDPVSRSARDSMRQIETATNRLRSRTGIRPTPEEISAAMGISGESYARATCAARESVTFSLSGDRVRSDDSDVPVGRISADTLPDERQADPAQTLAHKLLRETVTSGFSRYERLITILYYYEGMKMNEIALTLGLSESRVSQIHASIVLRLKARFNPAELAA